MEEEIKIPLSKKKTTILFIGSLAFLILSSYIFVFADEEKQLFIFFKKLNIGKDYFKIIGAIGMFFFGIIARKYSKKLIDKSPGLIINSNGIIDNSSAANAGLIEWNEIQSIHRTKVNSINFISIIVKRPEKFINQATSKFKSNIMQLNLKLYKTPIHISSNILNYDFEKLEDLIITEFKKRKNAS